MEKTTFLRRYAEWVRKYPERAKRVEEVLRLVSFVVPVRRRLRRWGARCALAP